MRDDLPSGSPPPARPRSSCCSAPAVRRAPPSNGITCTSRRRFRDLARRQVAHRGDRQGDRRRVQGQAPSLRHVADQPEQHHPGGGENVVQLGDDLFNSGNITVAGIPRLPMLIQSYEDFAKADAVLKPYIERRSARRARPCCPHLYPMQVIWGRKKLESLDDIKGMFARRAARAGRVRPPVGGTSITMSAPEVPAALDRGVVEASSPPGRRRAVEGPAQIRLPAWWSTSTTPISSPTPTPTRSSIPTCRAIAQGRRGHRALEPGHHEARGGGRSRPCLPPAIR